ncbi:MAG TPA: PEGA domain-containing protein [Vicinamibacteria bacterium]|nr:PEGA domain-containing protein [Vicinamibacteria bacterium]
MTLSSRSRAMLVVAVALAAGAALAPAGAEARGWGGHGVHVRGFVGAGWGFAPWWGFGPYWGWGPYPPAYYQGGPDMNAAMIAGYGAVDLNVKPNQADVWVDGKYVAEARDLDGDPSYLWLPEGAHRLAIYKGGFLTFDEPIEVRRGMKSELKVRLQPGDSQPPGPKPADEGKADDKAPAEKKY